MARFKRRKPRVLWLPVIGNDVSPEGPEAPNAWTNGPTGELTVTDQGEIAFDQVAITFDYSDPPSFEMGAFQRSLQDLSSGNAYRLRRIVGKIFVGAITTQNAGSLGNVDVAAGFIVNKTDDAGNPLSPGLFGNDQTRAPLALDAVQDPWIWRRRWRLSPIPKSVVVDASDIVVSSDLWSDTLADALYPQTNVQYGSVADGPHIDQKTARVISNNERLFFWISARRATNIDEGGQNIIIPWSLDLRLLASLRSNQGNRRNASR